MFKKIHLSPVEEFLYFPNTFNNYLTYNTSLRDETCAAAEPQLKTLVRERRSPKATLLIVLSYNNTIRFNSRQANRD